MAGKGRLYISDYYGSLEGVDFQASAYNINWEVAKDKDKEPIIKISFKIQVETPPRRYLPDQPKSHSRHTYCRDTFTVEIPASVLNNPRRSLGLYVSVTTESDSRLVVKNVIVLIYDQGAQIAHKPATRLGSKE